MSEARTSSRFRAPVLLLAVSVVILVLGAIENLYGNTDSGDVYGADAVQYLDIARAIGRGDWHSALNPLWSQGYPALLATVRPMFAPGPDGDWNAVRTVNFTIFSGNYLAFLYLFFGLMGRFDDSAPHAKWRRFFLWAAGLSVFTATQICLGQVSRVNPDELVTTLFFLASGMIVRLLDRREPSSASKLGGGAALGLVLGAGFIVKAIFLALGCGMLVILAFALRGRNAARTVIAAAAVFAGFVGSYGAALSHAVGKPTLGEAGSINYAWHVNRLQKWVHWEGGTEPASEAWPSPRIAQFAQWDAHPPDFGAPIHPSVILQQLPLVYGFSAPFHATYVPYYDPPYWYRGYRHLFRPRYQLIALVKSVADLLHSLATQPMFFAVLVALAILLRRREPRLEFVQWLRGNWAIVSCGMLGVAIYLPVHLEGRYLAGFLTLLAVCALFAATEAASARVSFRAATVVLLIGLAADLAVYQRPVWRNLTHHRSPQNNVEWRMGEAVLHEGLAPMSQVGVIAWTANLHCDWAYMAHLQITSEIASGQDFDLFWHLPPESQRATLATFRSAGAAAVLVNGKPPGAGGPGWRRLGETPMWMYRF